MLRRKKKVDSRRLGPEGGRRQLHRGGKLGGGSAATGAGASEVAVTEAFPSSATQWTTRALEVNATAASWKPTAYAICGFAS